MRKRFLLAALVLPLVAFGQDRQAASESKIEYEKKTVINFDDDTIQGDLLDVDFLASLPETANVIYMAGRKFGRPTQLGQPSSHGQSRTISRQMFSSCGMWAKPRSL